MNTLHSIFNTSSKCMKELEDSSIDLVVTSPPYPMVSMWDECFISQNDDICKAFENKAYNMTYKVERNPIKIKLNGDLWLIFSFVWNKI